MKYWGVGNESWGCGGNFTGDEYAVEFRRFIEWVPQFDVKPNFIASGPNVADYAWTRSFFQKLTEKNKRPLRSILGVLSTTIAGPPAKVNRLISRMTTGTHYLPNRPAWRN